MPELAIVHSTWPLGWPFLIHIVYDRAKGYLLSKLSQAWGLYSTSCSKESKAETMRKLSLIWILKHCNFFCQTWNDIFYKAIPLSRSLFPLFTDWLEKVCVLATSQSSRRRTQDQELPLQDHVVASYHSGHCNLKSRIDVVLRVDTRAGLLPTT